VFMPPVFDYFPVTIRRDKSFAAATATASAGAGAGVGGAHSCGTLEPDTPYIYGYHPHGIYAYGLFALVFPRQSGWARIFPASRDVVVGVANALLNVPVCGHLFKWFGFVPADRASLRQALRTPRSLALIPGGIAEMLMWRRGQDVVYLRKRLGFVRLAIQSGRSLVPVFAFGETSTFRDIMLPPLLERARNWLSRRFRVALVPFRGRWFSLVPFRVPITVVVGAPVRVQQQDNPSPETVAAVHQRYIEALQALHARHRDELSPRVDGQPPPPLRVL